MTDRARKMERRSSRVTFLRPKDSKERQELRDRLRLAILTGDMPVFEEVLGDERFGGVKDLDKLDQNGRTAMLNAAFAYQLPLCLRLLDAGVSVTAEEKETANTLLHYLSKPAEPAEGEGLLTLKTILHGVCAKGANVNAVDREGCSPLHYAARVGNRAVTAVLLQHGAFVNASNEAGDTPLGWCVGGSAEGWVATAHLLLDKGANPHAPMDGFGRSVLAVVQDRDGGAGAHADLLAKMIKVRPEDVARQDGEQLQRTSMGDTVRKGIRKVVAVGALAQELEKKRESASTDRAVNVLDLTLISEVSSDNIHVDYGSPGLRAADANVRGLYSQYQAAFFGATHFLFLLRSATAGCKIVAVLRAPDETRNAYYSLVINTYGMFETWIDQAAVVGDDLVGQGSPRDLEARLEHFLRENWSTSAIDWKLLDSRVEATASFAALQVQQDKNAKSADVQWISVSPTKSDLPCLLLGLECRLGHSKCVTVGVVYNAGGQTEEEAFLNTTTSPGFEQLLSLLAVRVPLAEWRHFRGGVSPSQTPFLYYTSWRGFEVVFHVAPYLSAEARRQFIGNDKVLLHYVERGPVAPVFRGNVNSVGIVVTSLTEEDACTYGAEHINIWGAPAELFGSVAADHPRAWRVGVFSRKRVTNFKPCVTTSVVRDPQVLRDALLATVVNGTASVLRSPPYSNNVDTLFAQETEGIVERFFAPDSAGASSGGLLRNFMTKSKANQQESPPTSSPMEKRKGTTSGNTTPKSNTTPK